MELVKQVEENNYYDHLFLSLNEKFNGQLTLQKYDAYNIQFDCLKEVIEHFEAKNGRTSDYGFYYIKYFARAC